MASEVTVPGNTTLELIEHWGSTPEHDTAAFISVNGTSGEKRQLSRKEVLDLSKRFAHKLSNYGIKKGDIVCNALPNSLERIVCEFGIHFSGAASMNGQTMRSDGEDFIEAVKTSRCTAVILDPTVPKSPRNFLLDDVPLGREDCIESKDLPHLKRLIICKRDNVAKENDFIESLRNEELQQFRADVVPSDLATVMTTSGSTGYSKLVMHTHANICHFGKQVKAIEPMPGGTHFVNCAQLGWAGGYPQWYLSCGVTRYFIDLHDGPPLDTPASIWKIVDKEKIDYGFLSPAYAQAIVTSLWEITKWRPRTLCLAGQPIKRGHLSVIGKLCGAVDVNYGMTECNLVSTHRVRNPAKYVDGCAGFPGYGVKIKVVDANKEEVPQGSRGEILVWSPSLCTGYLNNESAKAAFTSDGWLCTDDAGYIGTDGKLYIEGRQSDCIHRGVYILYPGWLENKLKEFPGVKDVAVVAVPDAVLHNEVCACVAVSGVGGVIPGGLQPIISDEKAQDEADEAAAAAAKDSEDIAADEGSSQETGPKIPNLIVLEKGLRALANDLNLLHEKDAMRMVPKFYVFMDRFPTTSTGKLSRKEIAHIAKEALKLE